MVEAMQVKPLNLTWIVTRYVLKPEVPPPPPNPSPYFASTDCLQVILSVFWKNGKLGAASYSLQNPVVSPRFGLIPSDLSYGFVFISGVCTK